MKSVLQHNSNCIDIGCHKGEILDSIITLCPNGKHIGFEPLPDFFKNLELRYQNNKDIKILPFALSNDVGESEFVFVKTNPAYSGIRQRKYDSPNEKTEKIKVKKDTLDNSIPPDIPIQLIKIDVEGGEYEVLEGARNTIQKWKPYIIFEHGLGAADYYNTSPEKLFELISEFGMKISNLDQFLLKEPVLNKIEFSNQFKQGIHYYFLAHS